MWPIWITTTLPPLHKGLIFINRRILEMALGKSGRMLVTAKMTILSKSTRKPKTSETEIRIAQSRIPEHFEEALAGGYTSMEAESFRKLMWEAAGVTGEAGGGAVRGVAAPHQRTDALQDRRVLDRFTHQHARACRHDGGRFRPARRVASQVE